MPSLAPLPLVLPLPGQLPSQAPLPLLAASIRELRVPSWAAGREQVAAPTTIIYSGSQIVNDHDACVDGCSQMVYTVCMAAVVGARELGARLLEARTARGWAQSDLASRAGVTKGYISKLESGKSLRPSQAELGRVLAALGFASVDELLHVFVAGDRDQSPLTRAESPLTRSEVVRIAAESARGEVARIAAESARGEVARIAAESARDEARRAGLHQAPAGSPAGSRVRLGEYSGVFIPRVSRDSLGRLRLYDYVGAARRMMEVENFPDPVGEADPPASLLDELGPDGFGLRVRGDSMAGLEPRPILPDDIVWINPQNRSQRSGVVAALVEELEGDEPKAVVKWLDAAGGRLWSILRGGRREELKVRRVLEVTAVLGITYSGRLG